MKAQVLRKALKISSPLAPVSGEVLRFHDGPLWHQNRIAGVPSSILTKGNILLFLRNNANSVNFVKPSIKLKRHQVIFKDHLDKTILIRK